MVISWASSRGKWYSVSEDSPQGGWDKIAEKMMLKFAESGHSVFRATSPLSRWVFESKGGGKLSIHYCTDFGTIETVLRTVISVNQLSLYGEVAETCEEYESCPDRTGRPVVRWQSSPSFVPSVIKTNILLTDDPAQEEVYCKDTRNELKSYHNKIEWLNFVLMQDSWPQLMSDSTSWQKRHWRSLTFAEPVTCREYTLPRYQKSTDPKGWIRENTKIEPVSEVTTSYSQGKYGVEIGIESVSKDTSHSWVGIFSWLE